MSDGVAPTAAIFSPRLLIFWVGAAVLLFVATLYAVSGSGLPGAHPDTVGPSTFSRSAIGYAGFADRLRELGVAVVSSQYDALARLTQGSVLVIAEPEIQDETIVRNLLSAQTILLVLPKWHGRESKSHGGWLAEAELVSPIAAQTTLALLAGRNDIVRAEAPPIWAVNRLGITPTFAAPVQLMNSDRLRPVIAGDGGMLLGELIDATRRIWILADPDILENHGLAAGRNDALGLAIIGGLRRNNGRVVFDETVHGFTAAAPTSPFLLLFRFPFVVATLQAVAATALLLWATMGRFGAPETAPPPLVAGKEGLIRNAARLLEFGGDQPIVMQRYVQALFRDTARELHAPAGLAGAALLDWLRRVGEARGLEIDCVRLAREVDIIAADRRRNPSALVALVAEAHRWKQGIIDGIGQYSRHH